MTETMIPDAQPVVVARRPIERRGGVEYVGGTAVQVSTVAGWLEGGWSPSFIASKLELPLEAVEFVARREAKKAKRKDPVRRQLKANGRACRQRGYKAERSIVDVLGDQWERVPLSGALGGRHKGDVRYIGLDPLPAVKVLEVKRRQGGIKTLERWFAQGGGVDGVVIVPANGAANKWVFEEATALRLLEKAGLLRETE